MWCKLSRLYVDSWFLSSSAGLGRRNVSNM